MGKYSTWEEIIPERYDWIRRCAIKITKSEEMSTSVFRTETNNLGVIKVIPVCVDFYSKDSSIRNDTDISTLGLVCVYWKFYTETGENTGGYTKKFCQIKYRKDSDAGKIWDVNFNVECKQAVRAWPRKLCRDHRWKLKDTFIGNECDKIMNAWSCTPEPFID